MAFYLIPTKKRIRVHNPLFDGKGFELLDDEGQKMYTSVFEEKWFWLWFSWKKFLWWK